MRFAQLAALVVFAGLPHGVWAQSTVPASPSAPAAKADATPEMKARFEKFRATCGADVQAHCASVPRGTDATRGEMRQCIDTHKAKFSAACQSAVAERDAARDAKKSAPLEKPKS